VQDSPKKFVFCNILFERVLEDKKIRNEWTWYIYPSLTS
jgi:hypothetical protein